MNDGIERVGFLCFGRLRRKLRIPMVMHVDIDGLGVFQNGMNRVFEAGEPRRQVRLSVFGFGEAIR